MKAISDQEFISGYQTLADNRLIVLPEDHKDAQFFKKVNAILSRPPVSQEFFDLMAENTETIARAIVTGPAYIYVLHLEGEEDLFHGRRLPVGQMIDELKAIDSRFCAWINLYALVITTDYPVRMKNLRESLQPTTEEHHKQIEHHRKRLRPTEDVCIICHENFAEQPASVPTCGHYLHHQCSETWLKQIGGWFLGPNSLEDHPTDRLVKCVYCKQEVKQIKLDV